MSSSETAHRDDGPDLKELRERIPAHCFESSLLKSIAYVIQDLILMATLCYGALRLIPLESSSTTVTLWTLYGVLQGFVFTGLWVLAHECGHNAFSDHRRVNSCIGFLIHSFLMVPFFSWKYSHSRHHRFTNHMGKDTVFVPPRQSEHRQTLWNGSLLGDAQDAPIVSFMLLLGHQLLGWPMYIFLNAGAGELSLASKDRSTSLRQSHLDPTADLFTAREQPYVFISNLGLIAMACLLAKAASVVGLYNLFLVYGIPYLWMNHWLVAITFLHHTHHDMPRYEDSAWTFRKGALGTIDRDFGLVGRYLFHGIIEYHVIHHIFPRIPFYHAQEATEAIQPLLGKSYRRKQTNFIMDLWTTFRDCSCVEERQDMPGQVYWS